MWPTRRAGSDVDKLIGGDGREYGPVTSDGLRQRFGVLSLLAMVFVAVVGLLFAVDPEQAWYLPPCLFHRLTGWYCPGCGMTRALHALLHGHLGVALRDNALVTVAVPAGIAWGLWQLRALGTGLAGRHWTWRPAWIWWLLILLGAFGILRNLPWYPFTLLTP